MKKTIRFSIIFVLLFALTVLSGCGKLTVEQVMSVIAPEPTQIPGSDMQFQGEQKEIAPVLSLTYEELVGVFSPFYAETDGDLNVVELTQLSLRAVEGNRSPSVITRSMDEDDAVVVTVQLQPGLKCADGRELTADDLLFTYYVMLDNDYSGPYAALKTLPIRGLSAYWNGMDGDMFGKYLTIYNDVYNGGNYDEDLKKAVEEAKQKAIVEEGFAEEYVENDPGVQAAQKALDDYDSERADEIRAAILEAWEADVDSIVDYTMENYAGTISLRTSYTKEEVLAEPGLQVMYAMLDRGFGALNEDGSFTSASGVSWDLKEDFPAAEDFFAELKTAYNEDVSQYWAIEGFGRADLLESVQNRLVTRWAREDEDWRGEITSISGLEKTDEYTVRFTMNLCDDSMLKLLTNIYVVPMHIYGDEALFDPNNGSFGFTKGDLSAVRANNGLGLGAGEFSWDQTEIFTVTLLPNPHYWLGMSGCSHAELNKKL